MSLIPFVDFWTTHPGNSLFAMSKWRLRGILSLNFWIAILSEPAIYGFQEATKPISIQGQILDWIWGLAPSWNPQIVGNLEIVRMNSTLTAQEARDMNKTALWPLSCSRQSLDCQGVPFELRTLSWIKSLSLPTVFKWPKKVLERRSRYIPTMMKSTLSFHSTSVAEQW